MVERHGAFELRLAAAALLRHRSTLALALVAMTIGAALSSALLHVTRELGPRVAEELRALGPNLVVVSARGDREFIDLDAARPRLAALGLEAVPVLYATVPLGFDEPVPVVGTDVAAMRRLHPEWRVGPGIGGLMGTRLAGRVALSRDGRWTRRGPGGVGGPPASGPLLETGGPEDDLLWLPIEVVAAAAGREGRASLFQARVRDASEAGRIVAALARDAELRAAPLHGLTTAEGRLLDRTRVLMTLVSGAAVVAALLCTVGTLTDLALARRRDVATLRALGAARRDVVRLFATEAAAIGLAGGTLGFAAGAALSWLVSREVFHAGVGLRWDVLPVVLLLSIVVSLLAAVGPVRLALSLEPAPALKED